MDTIIAASRNQHKIVEIEAITKKVWNDNYFKRRSGNTKGRN